MDEQIILNPIKGGEIMKHFALIVSMLFLLAFVACGQGEKTEKATTSKPQKATETVKEKAAETAEAVKEKVAETAEKVEKKADETAEKAKKKAKEAAETVQKKIQWWSQRQHCSVKENDLLMYDS